MQKIYIDKLLHGKNFAQNFMSEPQGQIALDFSNVSEIRLEDVQRLLDLQKTAVLNEMAIKIENLEPNINKILKQTGLYKTLNTSGSNMNTTFRKRLALE